MRRYYGFDPLDLTYMQWCRYIRAIEKIERLFHPPPKGGKGTTTHASFG